MTFISLFVITVLLLAIPFTRSFAVVGLLLLLFAYPYLTTVVLLVAAGGYFYFQWRKSNV